MKGGEVMLRWTQFIGDQVRFIGAWLVTGGVAREFKRAPVSFTLVVCWVPIGLFVWSQFFIADINIVINVVVGSILLYILVRLLHTHKLRDFNMTRPVTFRATSDEVVHQITGKRLADDVVLACFAVAVLTALFYSSLISGDWIAGDRIASACFGNFRIHHWQWSTYFFVMLLLVYAAKSKDGFKRLGTYHRSVGFVMLAFSLPVIYSIFWDLLPISVGFWIMYLLVMVFSFALGIALQSKGTCTRWFVVFIGISFGIALGVMIDGVRGIIVNWPDPLMYLISLNACSTL